MPFYEGLGFDDHESVSPIKKLAETDYDETKSSRCSFRFSLTFLEHCELLSEEEILRNKGDSGGKEQTNES
jgi:hypothetical protein